MEHNINALLPRLAKLRRESGRSCCLELEIWDYSSNSKRITWRVYDGIQHYDGLTPEAALEAAEIANDVAKATMPDRIIIDEIAAQEAALEADRQHDEGRLGDRA